MAGGIQMYNHPQFGWIPYSSPYSQQDRQRKEEAERLRQAQLAGTATGTQAGAAITTLRSRVPDLFPTGADTSTTTQQSTSTTAPRVGFPSGGGTIAPPTGGTGMPAGFPTGRGSPIPREVLQSTADADAARFGRAKDQIGQSTQGAVTSLRSILASQGQAGGSRPYANVMQQGQQQIGDTLRELAIQGSQRDAERAALSFQGGITQRGQDISAGESAADRLARLTLGQYEGEITQRGQDLASQRDAYSFELQQRQQQQLILDRILNALGGY